jgi:hypothetical protein
LVIFASQPHLRRGPSFALVSEAKARQPIPQNLGTWPLPAVNSISVSTASGVPRRVW